MITALDSSVSYSAGYEQIHAAPSVDLNINNQFTETPSSRNTPSIWRAKEILKITFLGNVNNFPFILARTFRSLGHEVTFLIDSARKLDRPEYKYRSVAAPYPQWIVDVGVLDISPRPSMVARWINVWRRLRQADFVVLNGFGIRVAPFLTNKVLAILTGSDVDLYASKDFVYKPPAHLPGWKRLMGKAYARTSVWLMRTGIRKSALVWASKKGMLRDTDQRLEELGLDETRRMWGFLVDAEHEGYETVQREKENIRIFNATRFVWHEPLPYGMTPAENKGNDILIKGLGLLFARYACPRVEIVFVRKGVELEHTYSLIEHLSLTNRIKWVEELSQQEFYEQVLKADIVTEQFGSHLVGLAGYEAMQLGRPVVANGRLDDMERIYGIRPPTVEAKTPEEVCEKLAFLILNPTARVEIGRKSRDFVLQHFSPMTKAQETLHRLGFYPPR